jgi:hypothetical protein
MRYCGNQSPSLEHVTIRYSLPPWNVSTFCDQNVIAVLCSVHIRLYGMAVQMKCVLPNMVNIPASYAGGNGFESRPGDRLSSLRIFQSLQTNAGIERKNSATTPSFQVLCIHLSPFHWTLFCLSCWKIVLRPGRDADHSPHLVPRSRMSRSYTSSPPSVSMACSGTAYF